MSDFYSLLARKIEEVKQDPARTRQAIYEAARAALHKQAHLRQPYLTFAEIRRRMSELEQAIAQIEAEAAMAPAGVDEPYAPGEPASPAEPSAAAEALSPELLPETRHDVIVAPSRYVQTTRGPRGVYDVDIDADYDRAGRTYYAPPPAEHPSMGRRLLSGFALLAQLTIASAAGVTIYALLSGRGLPTSPPPPAAPAAPAVQQPAEAARALVAPLPATFPLPTMFGVYAIRDGGLFELHPAATAPVDPRTRNLLQISTPPRTTFLDGRLSFIVFRRDLIVSAPDHIPVRIAAKISRMMNFDSNGRVVTAAPPTDTWFIRDVGFDLRVLPVRESKEMVLLRPDDADFVLPPGRYELLIGNQPYDFAVDGRVIDPAHCVEGSATVRGPVFYECRRD